LLSVSKPIKAGQGEYYLRLSTADDYYLSGMEPKGFWLGEGAESLGLSGEVKDDQFRNLLRGLSPEGERKLVKNADLERRAGWDLTWSVPKSVSVLWSQADPIVRAKIEACVRNSVKAGVAYLEEVAGFTRRGEDGWIREKGKLSFAAFEHSTSRAQDPQLHIHTVLLNVAVRADGSTGTVEPREIYRHQLAAGALFRAELSASLERELGLRSMREGRAFELLGVDRELMDEFSKRRAQILAALSERGLYSAKAAEVAALNTREKKDALSREELFSRWREIGEAHHWSEKEVSFLVHAPFPKRDHEKEMQGAANDAIDRLTTSQSHFSVRQLTQALAEEAQARGLDAKDTLTARDSLLRTPELVFLCENRGEMHWTTREILELEKAVLQSCAFMHERAKLAPQVDKFVAQVMSQTPELSGEQKEALRLVCEATGGVRVVSGLAGTGKSTLFRAAREVWESQGLSVIGASLSGKAARSLEESSGIKSQTLHRTLYDLERGALLLSDKTVLLIDEAAMIGTRQLARVVQECVKSGATLILSGDAKQLQAIELGGAFAELSRRYPAAELTEIRRQRDDWAKEAVKDFSQGASEKAIFSYRERGLVAETTGDHWTAMERLIADWSQSVPSGDRDTAILAATKAEVSALNHLAQAALRSEGQLGTKSILIGKEQFFEGDRILFTRNSMALSVMNGDRGFVREVDDAGKRLTVELDSGKSVQIDTQSYAHLSLGYALTTHKAQGMTVEKAFILVSDQMVDREMTYVQASRARGETRWYISQDLFEVTRDMAHSRQKEMALSFAGPELELTPHR
jgi:conjugative relaxase-like TrwC/TraI family protein